MELVWRPDRTASWLHAVDALWNGKPPVDEALATVLATAADGLRDTLDRERVPVHEFFTHAIPLAHGVSLRELAQAALVKVGGLDKAQHTAAEVSSQLAHLQAMFDRTLPGVAEQLRLRVEPLRLLWEARGPGLLAALGRMVGPDVLVERATIILVHPILGGGGCAHQQYNAVCLEAVLTNPLAELPEVVRLGWLLAQLNLDLPTHQGGLSRERALRLGQLALAAAVLSAAEEVELARANEAALRGALVGWELSAADEPALGSTVATLAEWWEVYRQNPPAFGVALAALDQML